MEDVRIDVLAWGVRNLAKYEFLSVNSPSLEFECNGVAVKTPKIIEVLVYFFVNLSASMYVFLYHSLCFYVWLSLLLWNQICLGNML